MQIDVLPAEKQDAEKISELSYEVGKIHDDAMPEYFRPTTQQEHLRIIHNMLQQDSEIKVFKAIFKEEICGFLCLLVPAKSRNGFIHTKTGVILNMGVKETFQRKGIGKALIETAETYLKEQGIDAIELDVFMFNNKAQRLYEKVGFVPIEQRMFKSF